MRGDADGYESGSGQSGAGFTNGAYYPAGYGDTGAGGDESYGAGYDGAAYDDATYDGAAYDDAVADGEWPEGEDQAYWRRRFIILGAGVVALAVCAWLVPGAHLPTASQAAATRASMSALARQQALPSAATGPSVHPRPKPAARPAATAALAAAPHKPKLTPATVPSGAKTGACAPGDIVLSLFPGQASNAAGTEPAFSVYAVSTSPARCTMTYGPGAVQVAVTSKGHVVWDSAACGPAPAHEVEFTLGVPQVVTLTWNRKAVKPAGCAGSPLASTAGTLDAVAVSHGQSSPVRAFKLGG